MRSHPAKILLLRRRHVACLAALAMAAVLFGVVTWPAAVSAGTTKRQLPIYSVEHSQPLCSISFDAAWGNEDTQTLIDILDRYGVNTTFFLVGDWAEKYPESVKALHDAGNEIMNHSDSHAHFSKLSADEIVADITRCNEKIAAVTGVTPTLFRCPYGEYDDHVINAVNSMGMTAVQWNIDSLDWKGLSAGEIQNRVLKDIKPGSIVLFHNAAENTPQALPGIIENLLAQGYSIVPVSKILLEGSYTIDHTGKQCPA